jgi:Glycosyl hydrolase family 12/Ricin-type beta-trefoil lectin domain
MRTRRTALFVATASLLLASLSGAFAQAAQPLDTTNCQGQGSISILSGQYTIQSNEWNSSLPQCVTYTSGTAWSMTTANFNLQPGGAPATYPSIYKGCHWGACTTGSGLPIQVSQLGTAVSSWSTTQPATGAYDVAYDIWINSTPTTPGQPDGTEVMIWLNSRGGVGPFGSNTGTSNAAGHNWNVFQGRQTSWNIISYVLQGGGTSFTNLDIKAMLNDAVARGSINPSHFLIDVEAGTEIWNGGQGFATNSFSFSATPNTNGGAPHTGQITGIGGKCVDVAGANPADGTQVQLFTCNGTGAQQWTVGTSGTVTALGKCLDVAAAGTANGTKVQLFTCNGSAAQQWQRSGSALINPQSGRCLDATGVSSADGTPLQIWACGGGTNQQWNLPA